MRNFAKRLMSHEAGGKSLPGKKSPATFQVCERLRPHLATLMGNAGFRALLSRALSLASAEVPWLRAVQVKADGTLGWLEEHHAQLDPDEYFDGKVVLLAHLLGLLVAFIGENLTVRLVCEVWPKLSLDDLEFGNGEKNEKAN